MKFERKGKAKRLTNEEIEAILNELRNPHRVIFHIQRYTGARIGEVVQIQYKDVDFNNNRINLSVLKAKKRQYRQLPIHETLRPVLKEYIEKNKDYISGYLFPGNKGKNNTHISTQSCDKALRNACLYLGYTGVSTHSFRVTVINNIWDNMPIKDPMLLAAYTGHNSVASLSHYLRISEEEKNKLSDYV